MAEVKFINHKGRRILLMDYSNSSKEESAKAFEYTKTVVAKEPPKSVVGLVDISGSPFDKELVEQMKNLAAHNKPYMKVSVVVGVEGIRKVFYQGILLFSGRKNILLMDSRTQALDYLASRQS